MRKRWGVTLAVLALLGASQVPAATASTLSDASPGRPSAKNQTKAYYAYPYLKCQDGFVVFGYEGTRESEYDWYGMYYPGADPGHRNGYYHGMATWKDRFGFTHHAWQWASTAKERQTGIRSGSFKVIYWKPIPDWVGHYEKAGYMWAKKINCS
ncbi:hypothetical protein [Streptomyces sp. NPDC003036]|uniref:hypothetical protein n=1 Tax=Streptomyces sp. NPDC003036 TaxID=3154442 RepID=UPI0033AE9FC6